MHECKLGQIIKQVHSSMISSRTINNGHGKSAGCACVGMLNTSARCSSMQSCCFPVAVHIMRDTVSVERHSIRVQAGSKRLLHDLYAAPFCALTEVVHPGGSILPANTI
jgi:hypothetical protein